MTEEGAGMTEESMEIDEELEKNNIILKKRVFGNFVEYNSIIFIDS